METVGLPVSEVRRMTQLPLKGGVDSKPGDMHADTSLAHGVGDQMIVAWVLQGWIAQDWAVEQILSRSANLLDVLQLSTVSAVTSVLSTKIFEPISHEAFRNT